MKKIISVLTASLLISSAAFANQTITIGKTPNFAPVSWTFNQVQGNGTTLYNPSGAALSINIVVSPTNTEGNPNSSIIVKNCGAPSIELAPGSSIVCNTMSSTDPVSFSTDNLTIGSSGTYQIELQKK